MLIDYGLYNEVAKRYPDKAEGMKGHDNIYRIWECNRYFQIPTPIKDTHVHYEVCPDKFALHFEGEDYEEKYLPLIEYLMAETESIPNIDWRGFGAGYWCCHTTVKIDNAEQMLQTLDWFMKIFDPLIEAFNQQPSSSQPVELDVKDTLGTKGNEEVVEMYQCPLIQLLELPLAIPDYQRIYCWEEKNVKCLLEDLTEHVESNSACPYRLGTVILHSNGGHYDIIDGQQRLVTLSLLMNELGVIPSLLKEKFTSKEAREYIGYNKFLIKNYCAKHIRNRARFAQALKEKVDFNVLVLQNASIDLAYTFFSNTNSRGVALTDYDLLKAHHLRFIPSAFEKQSLQAASAWNKMIEDGRLQLENDEVPDYVETLDTFIYHLRKWMRKKTVDESVQYRIKSEYEAASVIAEIPPFGEKFYFYEPIQGGTHFFSYVDQHIRQYRHFTESNEYKTLCSEMDGGSHLWYRRIIAAMLFGYYLKFGEYCLADALVVIMRIVLQHRYEIGKANKNSIENGAAGSEIIQMIDQATSPTFFLAEAFNKAKELPYKPRKEFTPIQKRMRLIANNISKKLEGAIIIESFKKINV